MDRPHLAWPIQFSPTGGGFVMAEQDSDQDIASCIATGVLWPLGTRDLDVEFGNLDPLGNQGGSDLAAIRAAASRADGRAGQLSILQDDDQLTAFISAVQIGFTGPGDQP